MSNDLLFAAQFYDWIPFSHTAETTEVDILAFDPRQNDFSEACQDRHGGTAQACVIEYQTTTSWLEPSGPRPADGRDQIRTGDLLHGSLRIGFGGGVDCPSTPLPRACCIRAWISLPQESTDVVSHFPFQLLGQADAGPWVIGAHGTQVSSGENLRGKFKPRIRILILCRATICW
ncbi:uncharacterized protein BO95DRAFT_236987 [Aspergillus brunneoviolaceus CBS 621.78]|uniref:Uncharacterized protein n=1 Tax=Aspergillus brunneoviolaceus CBS 621.78 TaxID=1450534 RepID=A0ACD1FZG3_9EURO|nr:hypothetical protein BO95DRAFT_236987 [Aspergillus brunneoviolaceus CBS 621.78]RAH42301.1 hypothetical protein BO95DRAFT_236987 [Aspergillus brunneoviolaceus CBS 621.78]